MATVLEKFKAKVQQDDSTPAPRPPVTPDKPFQKGHSGTPGGESRTFSIVKALASAAGKISRDEAKLEWDLSDKFRRVLKSNGYITHDDTSFCLPFGTHVLTQEVLDSEPLRVFKSMERAAAENYDPEEYGYITSRVKKSNGLLQSYLNEQAGGALVAPPQYMGLIDIYRNASFFDQVGVEDMPLPPQGRVVMSRKTGVTTAYWVGEGDSITQSGAQFGQFELAARKCAAYTYMPNELIRFSSPAADLILSQDIGVSLALKTDLAGLEGTGGTYQPKGLLSYTGTNEVIFYESVTNGPSPVNITANGNYLTPADGDIMLGLLEDRNFTPDGWGFRPSTWRKLRTVRSDSVTAGDGAGLFLVSPTRAFADTTPDMWDGIKVAKTAQISATRSKGSASNLTYTVAGQWKDNAVRARYGAVEFLTSNTTNDALSRDLTYIRGLMFVDFGFKRPGGFCVYDNLIGPRAS